MRHYLSLFLAEFCVAEYSEKDKVTFVFSEDNKKYCKYKLDYTEKQLLIREIELIGRFRVFACILDFEM